MSITHRATISAVGWVPIALFILALSYPRQILNVSFIEIVPLNAGVGIVKIFRPAIPRNQTAEWLKTKDAMTNINEMWPLG